MLHHCVFIKPPAESSDLLVCICCNNNIRNHTRDCVHWADRCRCDINMNKNQILIYCAFAEHHPPDPDVTDLREHPWKFVFGSGYAEEVSAPRGSPRSEECLLQILTPESQPRRIAGTQAMCLSYLRRALLPSADAVQSGSLHYNSGVWPNQECSSGARAAAGVV